MKKEVQMEKEIKIKQKQKKRQKNLPNIFSYLKNYKFLISLYIFCIAIITVGDIFYTILLADVITLVSVEQYLDAIIKVSIVCGISIGTNVIAWIKNIIYQKFSAKFVSKLSMDLSYQSFQLSAAAYANNNSGTLSRRILSDPRVVVSNLSSLVVIISDIIYYFVMCVYIFVINYIVGLVVFAGIIFSFVMDIIRTKIRKKNNKIANKKFDKAHSLTTEIIKSERDVKSLGLENRLKDNMEDCYKDYYKFSYKAQITQDSLSYFKYTLVYIIAFSLVIISILLLDRALITYTAFFIIYSNRNGFSGLASNFGTMMNEISDINFFADRMFALFDPDKFPIETFGTVQLDNVNGKIEFRNVSYAYADKVNDKDSDKDSDGDMWVKGDDVLKNASFTIKPNTTVAIVGESGSGKSTILSLISKMYEADSGQVLIDDVDIKELSKESIRNHISLVNQYPYIFDMSILDNMLLAKKDATRQEVEDAITKSCLREFVDGLDKGIDTVVGESGVKLSGGQRQRLAIARALLRKSSIILFDESTSSLDNLAQEYVRQSIDALKGTSTVVIVAHRLSTIKNADEILFLDKGTIVDQGTFDELFKKNEKFRQLFLAEKI